MAQPDQLPHGGDSRTVIQRIHPAVHRGAPIACCVCGRHPRAHRRVLRARLAQQEGHHRARHLGAHHATDAHFARAHNEPLREDNWHQVGRLSAGPRVAVRTEGRGAGRRADLALGQLAESGRSVRAAARREHKQRVRHGAASEAPDAREEPETDARPRGCAEARRTGPLHAQPNRDYLRDDARGGPRRHARAASRRGARVAPVSAARDERVVAWRKFFRHRLHGPESRTPHARRRASFFVGSTHLRPACAQRRPTKQSTGSVALIRIAHRCRH